MINTIYKTTLKQKIFALVLVLAMIFGTLGLSVKASAQANDCSSSLTFFNQALSILAVYDNLSSETKNSERGGQLKNLIYNIIEVSLQRYSDCVSGKTAPTVNNSNQTQTQTQKTNTTNNIQGYNPRGAYLNQGDGGDGGDGDAGAGGAGDADAGGDVGQDMGDQDGGMDGNGF